MCARRVGSGRVGSGQVGSDRIGSDRIGSDRTESSRQLGRVDDCTCIFVANVCLPA